VATAKFEVSTALLFRCLAGLKTSDLPTSGTSRKTSILKACINICSTKRYVYMYCTVIRVREKNILKSSSLERWLHVFWNHPNLEAPIYKKSTLKKKVFH